MLQEKQSNSAVRYLAFNKPYNVLCQFTEEAGSGKQTLAAFGFPKEVYPVGRLDYDSEGLLLLSNDGWLTQKLLDPKHGHPRRYLAQVENIPDQAALAKLRQGVEIEGKRTKPAQVVLVDGQPDLPERPVPIRFRKNIPTAWIELAISEGRNRQVRKMTAAVGHPTLRLVRIGIGDLHLSDLSLSPGKWRELSENELKSALART